MQIYKFRGLYLEVGDDTHFEFPDNSEMLSITGTFNVSKMLKSGKFVQCSKFQKKKMALSMLLRAADNARKILAEKSNVKYTPTT